MLFVDGLAGVERGSAVMGGWCGVSVCAGLEGRMGEMWDGGVMEIWRRPEGKGGD